eukprot:g78674.t1
MTELLELFVLGLWTGMVFLATVLVSRWLRGIFRYLKSSYRGNFLLGSKLDMAMSCHQPTHSLNPWSLR